MEVWAHWEEMDNNDQDFMIEDLIQDSVLNGIWSLESTPFLLPSQMLDFEDATADGVNKNNNFHDFKFADSDLMFNAIEECMNFPLLEDFTCSTRDCESHMSPANERLCFTINQAAPFQSDAPVPMDSDTEEFFDPMLFIQNIPEFTDDVSSFQPPAHKSTALVLDLDETLIHSTMERCNDADFMFTVFFNMKEHKVYVKKRPHLHEFLKRVAELFEVVIFTASESVYARQLLDMLDPEGTLISRRLYRDSCILLDGSYTKDLSILGVDLSRVAIIDNTPQVFRLQVNNGIPIKSWFSDPHDSALLSLLPFLERLVDADDVRSIIAKEFGNRT